MQIERLLAHIGLTRAPAADADGLRTLHRAFVRAVPYEALAVQLGETAPLEAGGLVARVLDGRRGGYCFEINTVLQTLLEGVGFAVERREALVGPRDAREQGSPTNHLALVVHADGMRFLADAGLGEGPLDPVALIDGSQTAGPLPWTVEELADGGFRLGQHPYGSVAGFSFLGRPAELADFDPHHRRLATSPESSFVQTLVVQQPDADRIVTLRARTLAVDGPGVRTRLVLEDAGAFAATLRDTFGIDPDALGTGRLTRLWSRASAQHERHVSNAR